jgi:thiol-disulfide isomerase/thioredoxin
MAGPANRNGKRETIAKHVRALLLVLCMSWVGSTQAGESAALPDPTSLFAATLWDVGNRPYPLAALRGRPLLVNFWARWCGPCRVEIPELVRVRQQFRDRGLQVVGIGIEDQADTVREFARAYEMDYTVLLAKDAGLPLMKALGNGKGGLPYTLVIDGSGRTVARIEGLLKPAELDAVLARLFRG